MEEFLATEFGLLLLITTGVWAGFFIYLLYIFKKMKNLQKEVDSLKAIESEE